MTFVLRHQLKMKHVHKAALVKPKLNTKMGKTKKKKLNKKRQNGIEIVPKEETEAIPATRSSDDPIPKKVCVYRLHCLNSTIYNYCLHRRKNGLIVNEF